jgi:hypothetical protein
LKKEVLDIVDPRQVLIPEADRNILANDAVARVPLSRWLKRDEVKTDRCSQPTLLPTVQLMLQPTLQLMLR